MPSFVGLNLKVSTKVVLKFRMRCIHYLCGTAFVGGRTYFMFGVACFHVTNLDLNLSDCKKEHVLWNCSISIVLQLGLFLLEPV